MPTYELEIDEQAEAEWAALDRPLRERFKKKLAEVLQNPRVPSAKLRGHPDRYKIKFKKPGYRLVYEVNDAAIVVVVIAVGPRDSIYDDL